MATEALLLMGDHRKASFHTLIVLRGSVVIALESVSPAKPSRSMLAPRAVRILNARSRLKSKMDF